MTHGSMWKAITLWALGRVGAAAQDLLSVGQYVARPTLLAGFCIISMCRSVSDCIAAIYYCIFLSIFLFCLSKEFLSQFMSFVSFPVLSFIPPGESEQTVIRC